VDGQSAMLPFASLVISPSERIYNIATTDLFSQGSRSINNRRSFNKNIRWKESMDDPTYRFSKAMP
jgi:hypothetical protein